ncbi:MAG: cell division protein FtsH [Thermotoga sp. 4484_232]|nr:ATP-dependent zinc metalloprotease FtsH [Thermotogaceae bacterium]OQX57869.1 MAG: cell division protein FtsH [Thermotoga sp. 4484_232]RKX53201.1 MAG: cell division protein FtsH [Thermotoga sp.]RKX57534.1 MAG: cell division protein FtsH [Thermotoga sp.]
MNGKPNIINLLFAILIVLSLFWLARFLYTESSPISRMSYSGFLKMLKEDSSMIAEIALKDDGTVKVSTKDGRIYEIYAPWVLNDSDLINEISSKGIRIYGEKSVSSSVWVNILGTLIPTFLIIFVWIFVMRTVSGRNNQAFTFTRSRARMYKPGEKKVTFDDVGGADEAIEELKEVVEFLKNPSKFNKLGARMPKGILLVGPPGTGKTLLARAVAGEANVPFFHISGSDFVELFVGVGAARVRDLFNQAKANAPCIIFIDEIDAVGRHRGAGLGGGHDEREQTLNQLLVEMDGFDVREGIIVMAATNRPDILDPALLRPGRFDKKVVVDPPDLRGRMKILKIHMKGKPIAEDVNIEILAKRTPGFVGADLENLVNEAALLAAREGRSKITMKDFEEAIDRVIAGPARKSKVISPKEKRIIAYHEVGHAIVSTILPNADPVHRISIIPRGYKALGYTLQLPVEDKYLVTKNEILDKITALLGGRAAEEIVFGEITSGAANDIEKATEMARTMVCELGMSDRLGPLAWGKNEQEVFLGKEITRLKNYSEEVASQIDEEVKRIVSECYERAKEILIKYRKQMEDIVEQLLEKETLEGEELRKILEEELEEVVKE